METRKSKNADLESKRTLLFQAGLIVSLSLALLAFEWRTPDQGIPQLPGVATLDPETEYIELVVPKKPEPPRPVNTTLINKVDNNTDVLSDIPIDIEVGPDTKIEPYHLPDLKDETPDDTEVEPFVIVEKMPSFPGGEVALMKFIAGHIKYPAAAREAGISGTVYLSFIVEPDGSISTVKVLRGIDGGCTEEALRVLSLMPVWEPGRQRQKPVRVKLNLPVRFVLVS